MKPKVGIIRERPVQITREAILAFNQSFAQTTADGDPLTARSMFAAGLLMPLMDEVFDAGHLFRSQSIKFYQPVQEGDEITMALEVLRVHGTEAEISFEAARADETLILSGYAVIQLVETPAPPE